MNDGHVQFVSFSHAAVSPADSPSKSNLLRRAMKLERARGVVKRLAGSRNLSRGELWGFLSVIHANSPLERATALR